MPTQQFVILSGDEPCDEGLMPLGPRATVLEGLGHCNTAPDQPGEDVLYGPGIQIELTPEEDPVTQMLLTVTEEEIGWQVIQRLAKRFAWRLLDPASGREWTP